MPLGYGSRRRRGGLGGGMMLNADRIQGFGPLAASKLEIVSSTKKPYTRCGLRIDKAVIEVVI